MSAVPIYASMFFFLFLLGGWEERNGGRGRQWVRANRDGEAKQRKHVRCRRGATARCTFFFVMLPSIRFEFPFLLWCWRMHACTHLSWVAGGKACIIDECPLNLLCVYVFFFASSAFLIRLCWTIGAASGSFETKKTRRRTMRAREVDSKVFFFNCWSIVLFFIHPSYLSLAYLVEEGEKWVCGWTARKTKVLRSFFFLTFSSARRRWLRCTSLPSYETINDNIAHSPTLPSHLLWTGFTTFFFLHICFLLFVKALTERLVR